MTKTLEIYVNGKYEPNDEASISVYDHGLFYGDGVFEAIRAYNGIVFKLKEHLDRLYESAKSLRIDIMMTKEKMTDVVLETLKRNGLTEAYIRIVVTRGVGPMGVDPRNCPTPTVIIIAEPREPLFGSESSEKGVKAIISSIRRTPRWALDPRIKTLNYINNILAKIEAIDASVEEAIMLNSEGYVAEASTENIFIIKGGKVATPNPTSGILNGITRQVVIEICKNLNYEVEERNITTHELFNADEIFVTGTGAEIVPINEVSGREIGGKTIGPVTEKIREKFKELVKQSDQGTVINDNV